MVILNTCHIRDKAAEKVFSELGRLRLLKDARAPDGGRMILAVAGCVAQAEGAEILARAPFVDIVLGPQTYHRLPEMVARAEAAPGVAVIETEFPPEDKFDHLPRRRRAAGTVTAFLTIQEGCDKFCSFCVVPYTRGAEQSRPAAAVLAEARRLVAQGAREITLLGQNVNAWHGAGAGRDRLDPGAAAAGAGGNPRPGDGCATPHRTRATWMTALIAAHRDVPALMPFLHLPVQSGSDRILAAMNRRHTAADYLRAGGAAARGAARPRAVVGFHRRPSRARRRRTSRPRSTWCATIGFAQAYSFKYSARPGTPAATAPDQVPEAEKDRRLAALQALLREQQTRFNAGCVGRSVPVLFTGPGRHPGQIAGRSPWLQPVHCRRSRDADRPRGPGDHRRRPPQLPCQQPPAGERPQLERHRHGPRPPCPPPLLPAARPSPSSSATTRCCRCCSAITTGIWCGSSRRWACDCRAAATGWRSPAIRPGSMWRRSRWKGCGGGWNAARASAGRRWRPRSGWPIPIPTRACRCPTCRRSAPAAARSGRAAPARPPISTRWPRHEMVFGVGPAGTGKTYLAVAQAVAMLQAGKVDRIVLSRPAVEAGERLGLPARRPEGEGRSLSAPAVRRAARHAAGRTGDPPHGHRRDRGGAARLHARTHPGPCLRDPGRGAEHHRGADEDVPHPHGRGHAHGDHRRSVAGRPANGRDAPACATHWTRWKACQASAWCASERATWCATRWSPASSTPTTNATPPARIPGAADLGGRAVRKQGQGGAAPLDPLPGD